MIALRDSIAASWHYDKKLSSWNVGTADSDLVKPPRCQARIDALQGQPDTLSVQFDSDTPDFTKGKHTLAEAKASCDHVARLGKVAAVIRAMRLAISDSPNLDGEHFMLIFYQRCEDAFDKAVAAGMSPTEQVPAEQIPDPRTRKPMILSGTIEDLKKTYCDPAFAKAKGKVEEREAPFRKVLKNDKLDMALKDPSFYIQGGKGTSDPGDLAKSNVWFRDASPGGNCASGGERHTIHRYQFDGAGKLTKQTDKDYCGSVPTSAFR